MQAKQQTIAVYIPKWLYRFDKGITIFVRGLYRSIRKSDNYRLLKITPQMCAFKNLDEAKAFVEKHNLVLVIYHGSRVLPGSAAIEQGIDYLEACVPFLNSKSVHVADNKFETKRLLQDVGIPVLPDSAVTDRAELWRAMAEQELYVAKPHNAESGNGVKLIKRQGDRIFSYVHGSWRSIKAYDTKRGLALSGAFDFGFCVVFCLFAAAILFFIFHASSVVAALLLCAANFLFVVNFRKTTDAKFIYNPLMLEPYYGDGTDEFYCLRCTVIGDEVVESAKKANKKNVTPNISHGGKASKTVLTDEQKRMAVIATKAVGATYAGIDLLVAKGKTVVCEVNVGPIGVYCDQTGVDVGGILGRYAIRECEQSVATRPARRPVSGLV